MVLTGETKTDKESTSAELTGKERLYRDALARALAARKTAVPASRRKSMSNPKRMHM